MTHDATIFGLLVADVLAEPLDLRRPPPPGSLVPVRSVRLMPGGNAANVDAGDLNLAGQARVGRPQRREVGDVRVVGGEDVTTVVAAHESDRPCRRL